MSTKTCSRRAGRDQRPDHPGGRGRIIESARTPSAPRSSIRAALQKQIDELATTA